MRGGKAGGYARRNARTFSLLAAALGLAFIFLAISLRAPNTALADGGCYDEFNCESLAHDFNGGQPFTQAHWTQQVTTPTLSNFSLQTNERASCVLVGGGAVWGQDSAWFRFDAGVTGTLTVTADSTSGGSAGFNLFMISYESTQQTGIDYSNNSSLNEEQCTAVSPTQSYALNIHTTGPTFVQVLASCGTSNANTTPCPNPIAAGPVAMTFSFACTDSDHDGVCDSVDACPNVAALTSNGCPPPAPSVTSAPTISGTTTVGQQLLASTGSWNGPPTSYAYQWERCATGGASCSAILGATTLTYTPTVTDIGQALAVAVTAANTTGSATSTSAPTAAIGKPPAPVGTTSPSVTGTAVVGHVLDAHTGAWSDDSGDPLAYGYLWQRCNSAGQKCSTIKGATNNSHKVTAADGGHRLRLGVVASNAGGDSAVGYSKVTGVVASPDLDSDHDGVLDAKDKCPFTFALTHYVHIPRGRLGCPGGLAVAYSDEYSLTREFTIEEVIELKGLAPHSRITVTCGGKGCPARTILSLSPATRDVNLSNLLRKTRIWHPATGGIPAGSHILVGQRLTISVSARGALTWYREIKAAAVGNPTELCSTGTAAPKHCPVG